MSLRTLSAQPLAAMLALTAMLALASPALADQAKTITATGTGTAKVVPAKPLTGSSIKAAVETSTKAAARLAIADARGYALVYAGAAGLTLGPVVSVSDAQSGGGFAGYGPGSFAGPGPFLGGPFDPGQFCHAVSPAALKRLRHDPQITIVDRKHRRVCFVPPVATDTLTVTYSAS